jgi:hypothetical protein
MKEAWQVTEPVHVEIGVGDRRVVRDFEGGETVRPEDDDDLAVIRRLEADGLAQKVKKEAAKAPAKASVKGEADAS